MREFDYIIIGGGCAGLSLAYELEINGKLKDITLAIIFLCSVNLTPFAIHLSSIVDDIFCILTRIIWFNQIFF